MPAPDWKALAEQVNALIRLAKSYTYVICGIALVGVFFMGKCQGKGEGEADFRDVEAAVSVKLHSDSAKYWEKKFSSEKKRGDSLEKKKDSVRIRYSILHDSLYITDTIPLIVRVADTVIVQQDSVIGSLKFQRLYLNSAVTERESQIRSLNDRLSISSKRIGRARREGFAVGAIVGGVAVLSIFAAK